MDSTAPPARHPRLGPYEIHECVGWGATATVWRALDPRSGGQVAVKLLRSDRADARGFLRLFQREAAVLRSLEHPAIPRVLAAGLLSTTTPRRAGVSWDAGTPYLVIDFIEGVPVHAWATEWAFSTLRSALLELLSALSHCHARGVIHRDVKPANLLVARDGVMLIDFGLAATGRPSAEPCEDEGQTLGSPSYMAPEQVEGDSPSLGPWTDLYSVGCTAWHMAVGRTPFCGSVPQILSGHLGGQLPTFTPRIRVPNGFERWLRRLMERDPADRFRSSSAAARALSDLPALGPHEHAVADTFEDPRAATGRTPLWASSSGQISTLVSLARPRPGLPGCEPVVNRRGQGAEL